MAVAILRLPTGIDFSEYSPQYKNNGQVLGHTNFAVEHSNNDLAHLGVKQIKLMHVDSNLNLEGLGSSNNNSIVIPQQGLSMIVVNFYRFH